MFTLEDLRTHIIIYGRYQDNWDGEKGNAITKEACEMARKFLDSFARLSAHEVVLEHLSIMPVADGTLMLEWSIPGNYDEYFVTEVGKTQFISFCRIGMGEESLGLTGMLFPTPFVENESVAYASALFKEFLILTRLKHQSQG